VKLSQAALATSFVAVAGCSGGTSPAPAPQPARFGIEIFWMPGGTFASQTALTQKCGLAPAYRHAARAAGATADSGSFFVLPSPVLTQSLTTCLSDSTLVMLVDILGAPAGSDR
jgi:hypothetical protein